MVTPGALRVPLLVLPLLLASGEQRAPHLLLPSLGGSGTRSGEWGCLEPVLRGAGPKGLSAFSNPVLELGAAL